LSLKQALQPMQSFDDNEEEDDDYEPVTPAPVRVAKPLGGIMPFADPPSTSSQKQSGEKKLSFRPHEDVAGPQDEDDLFAIKPAASTAFKPYQDSAPAKSSLPPGIVDDEDEDQWEDGQEEQPEDSDWQEDDAGAEEEYEGYPVEDGRWAPALTPITERTYEHTGNSKMWSTPLEVRDRSVMDTPFRAQEAFREAERLAAELRAEEDEEELSPTGEKRVETPHSPWEEIGQVEEAPIVDPYAKKTIAQLLANLPVPANHQDLRPQTFGHLEKLQKFVNPKGRKSASSKKGGEDSYPLTLNGAKYHVHRKLGEGGFGAVFLADDLNLLEGDHEDNSAGSALVAIKVVKPAIAWESFALDRVHSSVSESVRKSLITPRCLYLYQDESYHVLDYSNHGTLLEAVNKAGDLHVGSGLGGVASSIPGMDEMLAMFFTVELLRTLEGLHSKRFIHGDMKIDNCMVRLDPCDTWSPQYSPTGANGWSSKGIVLIDFGRVIDTSMFPPGTRFVTDWKMDKRDCLEMREGRPWTYETDYYGLAGIVYCLLYGKYMELPVVKDGIQKLSTTLKRYWKTALWDRLFTALLNPNGFGKPLPIIDELASIRQDMETWLVENGNKSTRPSTLRALVKRLEALSV
jgi:checkpoint serine/threonine-protein kinase